MHGIIRKTDKLRSKMQLKLKKLIIGITPPFLRDAFIVFKKRKSYPLFGVSYWNNNKNKFSVELRNIVDLFLASEDFLKTTKYWKYLLRNNLEQIKEFGLETYGKNIARNYYTWTDFTESNIKNVFNFEHKNQDVTLDIFNIHDGFSYSESIKHNILIQLLYNYAIKNDNTKSKLIQIDSYGYIFGEHPQINSDIGILTLDKLSSVIEMENFEFVIKDIELPTILEIGAGSGRTANALVYLYPNLKYVIADIPPANFVALTRLRRAFPHKRIYFVGNANEITDFIKKPETWDVLLVLPSLLEFFPKKFFDLMLAIDCLHEMNLEMRTYFSNIAEHYSKHYYFKIWNSTTIPLDDLELESSRLEDYGYRNHWQTLVSKECVFPSNFSEFLFKI